MTIRIIIAGPRGKMGHEAVNMVLKNKEFQLVGCIDRKNNGKKLTDISSLPNSDVPIFEDPEECMHTVHPDVLIDLTTPYAGFEHTLIALKSHVRAVVGTSGFSEQQIAELQALAAENKTGCIIAPNFAIGAVLMMQFSKLAARYLPDVEIIEKHHDQKLDAPSGTAIKTAELIKEARNNKQQGHPDEVELIPGARGAADDGIHIHSVRLPGLVAHQEVMFGGSGQILTIKHDSHHRESFMDGIRLSVEHVMNLEQLVYGLENILNLD